MCHGEAERYLSQMTAPSRFGVGGRMLLAAGAVVDVIWVSYMGCGARGGHVAVADYTVQGGRAVQHLNTFSMPF